MKIVYILDTCVLISDPKAFEKFPGHDVVIPIQVLDELDKLKSAQNGASKNARLAIRNLDTLCQQGEIHKGVKLSNGTIIKVDTAIYENKFGSDSYMDNKILSCAYAISRSRGKKPTILVSKDINLRVRANAYNIASDDFHMKVDNTEDLYSGFTEIKDEKIGWDLQDKGYSDAKTNKIIESLLPNQCVHVMDQDGNGMGLARKVENRIKKIPERKVWGLSPKSKEQAMALDLLMDPKVPMVSIAGIAGTGKSLLALAAALELVLEQKKYNKIMLFKPMNPTDKSQELGFLPGSMNDKLYEAYQSYFDSFEYLFSNGKKPGNEWQRTLEMYMEKGVISMDALAFLRGRSLSNAVIICDEIQNINAKLLKTILTRIGTNCKVIILGDIEQSDSNLSFDENALATAVESFKNQSLAGHISLVKSERSAFAELAAEIL